MTEQADEEIGEPTVMACMRVADLPVPALGSTIALCERCRERVWISLASRRVVVDMVEADTVVKVWCLDCVTEVAREQPAH